MRSDGQKVLLSIRNMGGESTAAWRRSGGLRGRTAATVHPHLDDLDARGLKRPEFVIVPLGSMALPCACRAMDGAPGLEAALTSLWGEELPIQRCTVHKHRNLLAHAPKHLHDELTEEYRDMIYADTAAEIETRRKAVLRNWRLTCRAVADSLEEAGDRLFTFTRLDPSQWKSARTTNAHFGRFALQIACRAMIERLNGEFRRRIKTQTVLPCAETVPMLLWALLASGQIPPLMVCGQTTAGQRMRKVDGWETLSQPLEPMPLDLAT